MTETVKKHIFFSPAIMVFTRISWIADYLSLINLTLPLSKQAKMNQSKNPSSVREFYQHRIKSLETICRQLSAKVNRFSSIRVILFVVLVIFFWRFSHLSWAMYVGFGVILSTTFLLAVKIHGRYNKQLSFQKQLLEINQAEVQYLNFDFSHADAGERFNDDLHPYTNDLDIFGKGSLFQYLNRSTAERPKKSLAELLSNIPEQSAVSQRQEAIKELSGKTDWRQHFQALGKNQVQNETEINLLFNWVNNKAEIIYNFLLKALLIVCPLAAIAIIILTFFGLTWYWLLGIVGLQLFIIRRFQKQILHIHDQTGKVVKTLETYASRIEWVEKSAFDSPHLQQIQERLSTQGSKTASGQINSLSRILNYFDLRLNMLLNIIFNGLFLWDLQCVYMLNRWKEKNKTNLAIWFRDIDHIDACTSLGTFAFNHSDFAYPELIAKTHFLQTENLAHPLIEAEKRIANDVQIDGKGKVLLITGSNMAGKSTFLRSAGINMVLANTGAPVCATKFVYTPSQIYTSMRVKDSLESETSTFYAELKRLKQILEALEKDTPVFVLLDEILKGTNSKDKLTGSKAYVIQLTESSAFGMVATHDLELGSLEAELSGKVENYSFEVQIQDDSFEYDYKLKRGICKTLNATELMKQMGIKV